MLTSAILEVKALDFDYPERRLLQQVNFSLSLGSLLHLRGANGAGKSTLLKILAGILLPEQGCIFFHGTPISKDMSGYQQKICYVGHKSGVNQLLTVKETYRFELQRSKSAATCDELMTIVGLNGLEDTPCRLLSAGQRRRVGLMRLGMSTATLWLLDEPFAALDKDAITLLASLIQQHLSRGGAVVLTSHQDLPIGQYQEYCL